MIMPSDRDYKQTKQIMLGKKSIKSEFKPLADWIDNEYGVKTTKIQIVSAIIPKIFM